MSEKLRSLQASFESALGRLEGALGRPKDEYVRDAAIQRFEFTFELLWKSLKAAAEEAGLRVYSPRDSLRAGYQLGLIEDTQAWFAMLADRNLTSRTYAEGTAEAIYARLPGYLPHLRAALAALVARSEG